MEKVLLYKIVAISLFLIQKNVAKVQTAPVLCDDKESIENNDLAEGNFNQNNKTAQQNVENEISINKLFHSIQCTLEKAKPWIEELQQEAKRLEEAAKLLGLGIINSFGEFVDKLVEEDFEVPSEIVENSTVSTGSSPSRTQSPPTTTEIVTEKISAYLCPEGFIADHNGICERIY